jgi:hypothetical protein
MIHIERFEAAFPAPVEGGAGRVISSQDIFRIQYFLEF